MREYKVYMHTFPNGKRYIGITKQNVEKRWSNGKHYKEQAVGRAIKKYGWDNIKHEIIYDNLTEIEACNYEQQLITKYKTNQNEYGYNKSIGGDIGKKSNYMCEEAIQFINQYNRDEEYRKVYDWWRYLCEDELESKVFNGAYCFVDNVINKHEDRIEWWHKVDAINIYLESWLNDWKPECARYNAMYFLDNFGDILYNKIYGKDNDEWKLKIPIENLKPNKQQMTIFDFIGEDNENNK